ncbi:hypothetical protein T4B_12093 [Trichinella pseudospiralis]|uniref:Uncharacterized protein n=2 Tax=Trichinella pseudospiralis TaxID=6337 RepID=A0A0V1K2I7_TRIPS|nr:hypothetical protein T4D_2001 [Trichinella pseudospiralis]KRZ33424.1 hypothetical protein T4B_12093 [Trichinella pseudospiralis]KRZ41272.1 hypothetical protein T4C_2797 [Trichinella pseudospiralis]
MATVELEGVFDQMRLTSGLWDEITSEAYLNVSSQKVKTPMLTIRTSKYPAVGKP